MTKPFGHNRRSFIKNLGIGLGASLLTKPSILSSNLLKGRVKQVVAAWPFMNAGPKWTAIQFLQNIQSLGVAGVELFPIEKWHLLKEYNLICAATKSHTFIRGMNNKNHHAECLGILEKPSKPQEMLSFLM